MVFLVDKRKVITFAQIYKSKVNEDIRTTRAT